MAAFTIPEAGQRFIVGNIAPAVDRDGTPQLDPTGIPIWEVRVMGLPEQEPGRDRVPVPEVLRVQVPAPSAPAVPFGAPVVFPGLTVRTWAARDGRQGLMYTAEGVRVVVPAQAQTSAPASAK